MATKINTLGLIEQDISHRLRSINEAWQHITGNLIVIEERQLWKDNGFESFIDYLAKWGWSIHWYHRRKTALKTESQVEQYGLTFETEGATRTWRSHMAEWAEKGWVSDLEEAIFLHGHKFFGNDDKKQLTSTKIRAINDVLATFVRTKGFVYDVEGEEMTAAEAAVSEAYRHYENERRDKAKEKSRYEYHRMTVIVGEAFTADGYSVGDEVEISIRRLTDECSNSR